MLALKLSCLLLIATLCLAVNTSRLEYQLSAGSLTSQTVQLNGHTLALMTSRLLLLMAQHGRPDSVVDGAQDPIGFSQEAAIKAAWS
jgi:hypothetical protein